MGIEGVSPEAAPQRPTVARPGQSAKPSEMPADTPAPTPTPSPSPAEEKPTTSAALAAQPAESTAAQANAMDNEDNGECHLLGPWALIVQGALGLLALSSLVYKRWRETPRRPLRIWFFDVSKQVFGSVLLHLANILMSMLSSGSFDVAAKTKATPQYAGADDEGNQPNPCSFYLLNITIDVGAASRLTRSSLTELDYHRYPDSSPPAQNSPQGLPAHPARKSSRVDSLR